ncbi:MAG: lipopolysaccharide transport periplasmic protein LptA [Thalassotalea sp.]|nr:lipopolysaccharide transport periplasmic protein LptA [Thalassotalea sp.]
MYKPFTKKRLASVLVTALLAAPLAQAAKIDLEKEILIKAGRTAGDLKNRIATYLDNVVISQGSLSIKADLVQVHSFENKDAETYVAKGEPAVFEQLLEDGSKIQLQADEIRYEPNTYNITITGNALLSQAGSEVRGSKIVYNTLTEQLEAEGGSDSGVTTILKPKSKGDNE